MNKTKALIVIATLIISGQVMAWTRVINRTDYPIQFRAATRGGDINQDFRESAVPPHGAHIFGGGMLLRYRYDVRVNYGDGVWRGVDFSRSGGDASGSVHVNDEGGNREIVIDRSDSGFWYLYSRVA